MKRKLLEECLDSIRRIQALKHNELDPGVTAELAEVAERLQLLLETEGDQVELDQRTVKRTLAAIGRSAVALDWARRIGQRFLE